MALDPAFPSLSLIALSVLALIGLAGLGFSTFWHARARKQAERACAAANAQRQDAVRLVRLVGHDLHEQGLSLLGQAGQLKQAGVAAAEWLSTSAGLLLGLADELGAYGLPDSDAHILRDQTLDLHAALAQAVALSGSMQWAVRQASEAEVSLTSAERLVELGGLPQEPPTLALGGPPPPPNWVSAAVGPPFASSGRRPWCSICGAPGGYACVRCRARFCGRRCGGVHAETRCLKMVG